MNAVPRLVRQIASQAVNIFYEGIDQNYRGRLA